MIERAQEGERTSQSPDRPWLPVYSGPRVSTRVQRARSSSGTFFRGQRVATQLALFLSACSSTDSPGSGAQYTEKHAQRCRPTTLRVRSTPALSLSPSLSALHSLSRLRADQDLVDRISYSDRYSDDEFEYRSVPTPPNAPTLDRVDASLADPRPFISTAGTSSCRDRCSNSVRIPPESRISLTVYADAFSTSAVPKEVSPTRRILN